MAKPKVESKPNELVMRVNELEEAMKRLLAEARVVGRMSADDLAQKLNRVTTLGMEALSIVAALHDYKPFVP